MSKQPRLSTSPSPAKENGPTLAKLQRIYGSGSVAPDVFGRRPALPSEVERLIKNRQPLPDQPQSACKPQHRKQNKYG